MVPESDAQNVPSDMRLTSVNDLLPGGVQGDSCYLSRCVFDRLQTVKLPAVAVLI